MLRVVETLVQEKLLGRTAKSFSACASASRVTSSKRGMNAQDKQEQQQEQEKQEHWQ